MTHGGHPPYLLGHGPLNATLAIALLTSDVTRGGDGSAAACGAKLAARHIGGQLPTDMPTPLVFANIELHIREHHMHEHLAVQKWREVVEGGALAVVGPGSSHIATLIGHLSRVDELPLCGYHSSAVDLSNSALYPYFGRTYPSDALAAQGTIQLLSHEGWIAFALIYDIDAWATSYATLLKVEAQKEDIHIAASSSFPLGMADSEYGHKAVESLAAASTNVYFVLCLYDSDFAHIIMYGDELGIVDRRHIWITGDAVLHPWEYAPVDKQHLFVGILQMLPAVNPATPDDSIERYQRLFREQGPTECAEFLTDATSSVRDTTFWREGGLEQLLSAMAYI